MNLVARSRIPHVRWLPLSDWSLSQLSVDVLFQAMSSITDRAATALAQLPEKMQEQVASHLQEQAEKLRALKAAVGFGVAEADAGRVSPFYANEIRTLASDLVRKQAASTP